VETLKLMRVRPQREGSLIPLACIPMQGTDGSEVKVEKADDSSILSAECSSYGPDERGCRRKEKRKERYGDLAEFMDENDDDDDESDDDEAQLTGSNAEEPMKVGQQEEADDMGSQENSETEGDVETQQSESHETDENEKEEVKNRKRTGQKAAAYDALRYASRQFVQGKCGVLLLRKKIRYLLHP